MKNSGIEWTNHTFNPWIGCRKVSPACKHCYAETLTNRFGGDFAGTRRLTTNAYWKQPIQWNREAEKSGTRPRVFCASLADVFEDWKGHIHDSKGEIVWHEAAGLTLDMDAVRDRLFDLINETPNLDWLLLTKRPENIYEMWPKFYNAIGTVRLSMPNVWLGTTVENQEQANKRIPHLLKCRDLSPVLFLSCEPLLGPIDLRSALWLEDQYFGLRTNVYPHQKRPIDWVIVGGESGSDARPMHPEWARDLRDQCGAAGVALHFKQWGEYIPDCNIEDNEFRKRIDVYKSGKCNPDYCRFFKGNTLAEVGNGASGKGVVTMLKVGKKAAGRLLDGREWNEVPR